MEKRKEEYWLSGQIAGVPALLQPAAHAVLQAGDEIHAALNDFDEKKLWAMPHGVASVGFHLQHIAGVIDRMMTYAGSAPLSLAQMKYLSEEGLEMDGLRLSGLLGRLDERISDYITFLKNTDPSTLTRPRGVGRKQLPSTVIGLLFHAAEHTMRHTGQLLVTAKTV